MKKIFMLLLVIFLFSGCTDDKSIMIIGGGVGGNITYISNNFTNNITQSNNVTNNITQNFTTINNFTNNFTNNIDNNFYTNITNNITSGGNVSSVGSTGYIPQFQDGTILNNSVIYQNKSYIGIGLTNPRAPLQIWGANNDSCIRVSRSGAPTLTGNLCYNEGTGLRFGTEGSDSFGFLYNNLTVMLVSKEIGIQSGYDFSVHKTSGTVAFFVNGTSDKVGIGTFKPTATLSMFSSAGTNPTFQFNDIDLQTIPNYTQAFGTGVPTTNSTILVVGQASSSSGGGGFYGFSTNGTNNGIPLVFSGHHGGNSPTTPAIRFDAWKYQGFGSDRIAINDTSIIAQFTNGAVGKVTILGNGYVGIGETSPGATLSVSGGTTIGSGYDTSTPPTNGLLVEGNVNVSGRVFGNYSTLDGTVGFTGTCTILGLTNFVVENGLITGCS